MQILDERLLEVFAEETCLFFYFFIFKIFVLIYLAAAGLRFGTQRLQLWDVAAAASGI